MADDGALAGGLGRLGAALHRWRRAVAGAWLALLAAAVVWLALGPAPILETESTGATHTEAYRVMRALRDEFGLRLGNNLAIVLPDAPAADRAALADGLRAAYPPIRRLVDVPGRRDPALHVLAIEVDPATDMVAATSLTNRVRADVDAWEARTGRSALLTGNLAFYADIARESEAFMNAAEVVALGFAFVILLWSFGGLLAAFLPLAAGASTLVLMEATLHALGLDATPMSGVLCGLLGMALAIDYALFIVSRYQEELARGAAGEAALAATLRQAGRTIGVSALIVLASIVVLAIPEVTGTRIMARNLTLVVAISVFNALVAVPAALALSGRFLAWPEALSRRARSADRHAAWRRYATHVTAHPVRYFVVSVALTAALAAPALHMRLWDPVQTLASAASESRRGYDRLRADGWGGELVPVAIVVRTPGRRLDDDAGLRAVHALMTDLSRHPDVAGVQSFPGWTPRLPADQAIRLWRTLRLLGADKSAPVPALNAAGDAHLLHAFPRDAMDVPQTQRLVAAAREWGRAHPEVQLEVGGVVARAQDFTDELYGRTPLMVGLVLAAIFAILFAYMRGVVLPVKAALMNFVPILGAFGVLTLVYGQVTSIIPITLFCITFGLAMDYEVLILSRITEAWHATGDPREAVVEGMARSGRVITGATLIFLAVFLPAVFAPAPAVQELGIGIVAALAIDATLVRLLLVPSFMMLMGRWNWR